MTMKTITLTRKFTYNSLTLPDPNVGMSTDAVKEFYALQYPELNNALIEGPVTANGVMTYQFLRAAGAKGRAPVAVKTEGSDARAVLNLAMGGDGASSTMPTDEELADQARFSRALGAVVRSKGGRAVSLPSASFGIWG
ncbi:PRTRC system protein C (plasmid) [Hydrogenophaga sp. PBL-H3]|jgi:PRTRC genetic system protein C|nr:PRTRC system protein C [Hydrogenophaga sp. PBL-H3]QHE82981.1 PRTRC system protein C [Hydrogenophaga sp. PBL-H3]